MRPGSAWVAAAGLLAALSGAWACTGEEAPEADRPGRDAPAASASATSSAGEAERLLGARSLLLITVDTLRADALGFAGNERVETPVLDRLAAGGRVFTRAHAHNVVTLPSHANILTGRLPYEHGIRDNSGFVLPESVPTAATLLSEAGFATAAFVAAFPLDARYGLDRGFDLYDDALHEASGGSRGAVFRLPERRGDQVVSKALAWWRRHEGERRFLWIHLFDPHAPYEPPEPWASRYADDRYLGEVAAVDAFLAPLLEPLLGGSGESSDTAVVFTSDHGEGLGEHGELTHGLFAYESTLRVPLVVRAPGLRPGRSDEPARHVDVLPTLLASVGVAVPEGLPGRSLLTSIQKSESTAGPVTYFEALTANLNRGWAPLRGTIEGGDKLIALPIPELYDLSEDPDESRNLYDAERRRARELARLLPEESAWPPSAADRREASAEERAALRSLGYLSGSAAAKESYGPADDPKNLVSVDREMHRFIDLQQRGRAEEAIEVVRGIVREHPDMGDGHYQLAQALLGLGRDAEALEVMEAARRRGVATPALVRQHGLLLAQRGRAPEAVALLSPLAESGDPDALNVLGVALSEAGRQREARETLLRVFDRDPSNPEAREHLALVALRAQDFAEARRQAELALAADEGRPLAWNYLGVAAYNLGQPQEAIGAWERATALDPGNYDLLYNLGLVAAEQGDRSRARAALERFVSGAPPERYAPDIAKARALLARLGGGRP
jgi:arylsulfatase A-like enzyme/Flp pilus assembly protein TadD